MVVATSVLAARGALFRKLFEGDPVAWTITGIVVAVLIIIAVVKKSMQK